MRIRKWAYAHLPNRYLLPLFSSKNPRFSFYEAASTITNKQYYRFIKTNSPTSKRVRLVTKVLTPACLSSVKMMPSIWQIISTKNSSLPLSFKQHQIYMGWHFQRSSFLILYAIMALFITKPFPALLCLDAPHQQLTLHWYPTAIFAFKKHIKMLKPKQHYHS